MNALPDYKISRLISVLVSKFLTCQIYSPSVRRHHSNALKTDLHYRKRIIYFGSSGPLGEATKKNSLEKFKNISHSFRGSTESINLTL